jgi:hypothetical protein
VSAYYLLALFPRKMPWQTSDCRGELANCAAVARTGLLTHEERAADAERWGAGAWLRLEGSRGGDCQAEPGGVVAAGEAGSW